MMAWTTPRTWVTGELVTATILNTYVRDNQLALDTFLGGQDLTSGRVLTGAGTSAIAVTGNAVLSGDLSITGALSKGSGSFRIPHPLPAKNETHQLVHSFIEGPQCDLIYRGSDTLVAGSATVNLDTASNMSEGTWVLLCRNEQCFTSNETGWSSVRGSVRGNILTIECDTATSIDTISWMVVAERHDAHILETSWTDEDGRPIIEPEKSEDEENAE
jgi:hypothetical protein